MGDSTWPVDADKTPLLVVLCGLPGAGKTTLAKHLAHMGAVSGMRVACIHFDDWLNDGGKGVGSVGSGHHDFDPIAWKASRTRCSEAATEALKEGHDMVILDDTMHYTSMLLQCWKLARANASMYCQVYVHCPFEQCMARNAARNKAIRMPQAVMERMGRIFEAPRESNVWDAATVVTSASRDVWQDLQQCKVLAPPLHSESELDPMIRALTTETVTHQVDIQSRRLLGQYAGRLNALGGCDTRETAYILNEERRKLLEACKRSFKRDEAVHGLDTADGATDSDENTDDPDSAIERWMSKFRATCESIGLGLHPAAAGYR